MAVKVKNYGNAKIIGVGKVFRKYGLDDRKIEVKVLFAVFDYFGGRAAYYAKAHNYTQV